MKNWLILAALTCICHSAGADTIDVRQGVPFPEVFYENSGDRISGSVDREYEIDGIRVRVIVIINGAEDKWGERLMVYPLDPMVIADPETADVPDGESVVVRLIPPMF